jgi:CspA family cold shock protein
MNFSDKLLHCQHCGSDFIFTVTEQRKLAEKGFEVQEPQHCPKCRTLMPLTGPDGKAQGKIKWFSEAKGYGFITLLNGEEIFVHRTGLADGVLPHQLGEGQEVEFEVEETIKGPQAVGVAPLSPEGEEQRAES